MTQETANIIEQVTEQVKPKRQRRTPKIQDAPVEASVTKEQVQDAIKSAKSGSSKDAEYDLYKAYQDYFEAQQKQVLATWTAVLNNVFWWTNK